MIATNAGQVAVAAGFLARRARDERTVKPCGPVPPTLGTSLAKRFERRRGLTSPVPRGERGAAVRPLRRECRSDFGVPVLACARLFCFARKAVGATCTLHSLRPR